MASIGSRKRVKPNPSDVNPPSSALSDQLLGSSRVKSCPRISKAAPVTEVARESISVAGNVTSELEPSTSFLPETSKSSYPRSIRLTKRDRSAGRSLPADAATTKIHIASHGFASTANALPDSTTPQDIQPQNSKDGKESSNKSNSNGKESKESPAITTCEHPGSGVNAREEPDDSPKRPDQSAGWFGWLNWSASVDRDRLEPETSEPPPTESTGNLLAEVHMMPGVESTDADQCTTKLDQDFSTSEDKRSIVQKRSWLQMWGGSPALAKEEMLEETKRETHLEAEQSSSTNIINVDPTTNSVQDSDLEGCESKRSTTVNKTSGWAFWSRDIPKDYITGLPLETQTKELSVPGESKQTMETDLGALKMTTKEISKGKAPNDNLEASSVAVPTAIGDVPSLIPVKAKTPEISASRQLQRVLPNQLLPSVKDTFAVQESPSLLQTIGRLLRYSKVPELKHVNLLCDPPRPKKALAIGVHGYFPAPFIRTVLGQPTGTSVKFANMAAQAIHRWASSYNYSCEVEKISLEGEGRISDRVDLLWKLLLNWMEDIRKADFILIACHSQGVPVAIMLVAKLISFGCLDLARIGICAMAGVNLGPFPDYKSRWIGGSAGELFEFALADSRVSQEYDAALQSALDFGVRISYVGSIDDQLVSLESSLFAPVSHPYIYRAVFVDGRVHAPSFLSHLVGFTLKLRNLGVSDHGLIRELSAPLVGSLYAGEGHSRLHDEEDIYYLAVEFALETSNINAPTLQIERTSPLSSPNPYILPFALRGLLEEDRVRRELYGEMTALLKQFDDWRPTTKVLKDVKFRLEGIRSKL